METRVNSKISRSTRSTETIEYENRKHKKRKANSRRTFENKDRQNERDDRITETFTEFDEAELLCLPDRKFRQENYSDETEQSFPKHYNVKEYLKLITAVDRRKYRNLRDLREHHGDYNNKSKQIEQADHSEYRFCYTQLRGQKCEDRTCSFQHGIRLPRKLRLCSNWKKGACPSGPHCLYLHSEYPCLFHYLGLKNVKHDSRTCRFHHGGPLLNEYEVMFLDSIDMDKYPMSREMYKTRRNELERTEGKPAIVEREVDNIWNRSSTEQPQDIALCTNNAMVDVTEVRTAVEDFAYQQNDPNSSDESSLQIDEKSMD